MGLLLNPGLQQEYLRCLCHTRNALCIALVECSRIVVLQLKSTHAGFSRDETTTNHQASTKLVYRYCETHFSFHRMMGRNITQCQWLRQLQRVKITVWGSTTVRLTVEPQHTLCVCFDCWTCWPAAAPMVIYYTVLKDYVVHPQSLASFSSSFTDKQHAH